MINVMKLYFRICILIFAIIILSGCSGSNVAYFELDRNVCNGEYMISVYGPNNRLVYYDVISGDPAPDIQFVSNSVLSIRYYYAIGYYGVIYVDVTNGNTATYGNPLVSNGKVVVCIKQTGDSKYVLEVFDTFAGEFSTPIASYDISGANGIPLNDASLIVANASIEGGLLKVTRSVDENDFSREETESFILPWEVS